MMQAVIIHGPQGCGKTRHAKDFCELYGCTAWTDDWLPGEPLVPGLLHLTFEVPSGLPGRDVQIISFDEAMKALGEKIVVRHLGTTTWQGPANQAPEFLGAQPGHNIAPVVSPAQMERLTFLIRAALAMAARLCNPPDQSEAARLTEFAAGCRHTMIRLGAAIRAIDPAEVLEKVGEVETTAGPWALDTSTGSEILVKGGCSVIEGEDARYLLRLIAADTSTPAPDAVARLVEAAIAEYLLEPPFQTELERMGRKATARGMMVRLGIYEKFKEALAAMEKPQ